MPSQASCYAGRTIKIKMQAPDAEHYAQRIIERLRPLDVRKVVLFGSWAWGNPGPDSDLDVLVVLAEPDVPQSSQEKGRLYRRVSKPLRDIQQEVPLDLMVHTEGMHRRFVKKDSMFARKVIREGRVIYEHGR